MKTCLGDLIEQMPRCGKDLIGDITGENSLMDDIEIERVWSPGGATERDLTFFSGGGRFYDRSSTKSLISIVKNDVTSSQRDGTLYVWTDRPRLLLAYLTQPFITQKRSDAPEWGHKVIVGENTVLTNCEIGNNVTIWHNVTIGGDGFSFEVDERNGNVVKIPHFGKVIIGDRVEIQSGTQIARGSFQDTIIEDDVKIDQLVHIAHNCHVKRGTLIPAGAMLAGSVTVGEYSWIAPETSVINGATLGRHSMTGMGAVVTKDVGDNQLVVGVPARPLRQRYPDGHPVLSLGGNDA